MKTKPVGLKHPNAFGLFDMHGNVFEYCEDKYDRSYRNETPDPVGPKTSNLRVIRGGSWFHEDNHSSAAREGFPEETKYYTVGFRVICELGPGSD